MHRLTQVLAVLIALLLTSVALAQDTVALPDPVTTGGTPFRDVLAARATNRSFKPDMITDQELADLLWAAWGVNREDGKRTAPSWANYQEHTVYVAKADGVWRWDAAENTLHREIGDDIRAQIQRQGSPLMLLFVADYTKMGRSPEDQKELIAWVDAGYISQNVYLHCAAEGMATVALGGINRDAINEALNLPENLHVILGQAVGYAAE